MRKAKTEMKYWPALAATLKTLPVQRISPARKQRLQLLIDYIRQKCAEGEVAKLHFICTHNARRSQLAQVWAQTSAAYRGVETTRCYSGGIIRTTFDKRALAALRRAGFHILGQEGENPVYRVSHSERSEPIRAFSKMYDDLINPTWGFAAVMTCSDAEQNCPLIPGAEKRIAIRYEDPKLFDRSPEEVARYDEICQQIAVEMFYVFAKIEA